MKNSIGILHLLAIAFLLTCGCSKDDERGVISSYTPPPPAPPPPPPATYTVPLVYNYAYLYDQWISVKSDSTVLSAYTPTPVSVSSYRWRKVSGPGNPIIDDSTKLTTQVRNLQLGDYIFEVSAMNATGKTDKDSVRIYVLNPMTSGIVLKNFFWICPMGCSSQTVSKIYSLVPPGKPLQVFIKYIDSPTWLPIESTYTAPYDKIYLNISSEGNFSLYADYPREGVKFDIKIEF